MKRVSVTDLRLKWDKIERALQSGQEIEIAKYSKLVGRLIPERWFIQAPRRRRRKTATHRD